jgi:hypothetical protein
VTTIKRVIGLLCVLHVLAACGFVGYLAATDRLNRDRIERTAAIFKPTIAQETADAEAAAAVEADALRQTERVMAITDKAQGVGSADERVANDRVQQELTLRRLERTRADVEALQTNLRLAQDTVRKQQEELAERQAALEAKLEEIENRANDDGFRKAVAMYESLPASQTKQMFLGLIESQQIDQVVAYLEAMQPRKAAAVLKEFKKPDEVARAVELTERLRARGSDLVKNVEATG